MILNLRNITQSLYRLQRDHVFILQDAEVPAEVPYQFRFRPDRGVAYSRADVAPFIKNPEQVH